MKKTEKLNFNVSARTARLIGRENVATSEGALIELVKNTYDADADLCIVYFQIPYNKFPQSISTEEYSELTSSSKTYGIDLDNYYTTSPLSDEWNRQGLVIPTKATSTAKEALEKKYIDEDSLLNSFFRSLTNIYIIDNGDGMDANTIKNNWMTIGTDNKAYNFLSTKGRTKSGEKGIGRFALDKLGQQCELTSTFNKKGLKWNVNWELFDQRGKNIDEVHATLSYEKNDHYKLLLSLLSEEQSEMLEESLSNRKKRINLKSSIATGTAIKITFSRDHWDRVALKAMQKGLESLAPPSEDSSFQLFLFNDKHFDVNGQLLSDICDDFDYKLEVIADNDLTLDITLYRNEFRKGDIPDAFFERDFCTRHPFRKTDFKKKHLKIKKDIGDVYPGLRDLPEFDLKGFGGFSFTLYFMKKSSNKKDSTKYYTKSFDKKLRPEWLKHNSGIKIFRDNFRIRPYGDSESTSWDWLDLGKRVAQDPAPAKRKGKWNVSPQNISGTIEISRKNNPGLIDKSSREGLQETGELKIFKNLVTKLIKVFEDDRSTIFSELDKFYQESSKGPSGRDFTKDDKKKADKLAEKLFEGFKEKQSSGDDRKTDDETIATAYLHEKSEKDDLKNELDDMKEENSLLRVFASSGITIASFTHELENLQTKLGGRYTDMKSILSTYVDEESFSKKSKFDNPFYKISLFEKEDKKLKHWLQYTLRTIRKDKRNRKKINLSSYFEGLSTDWGEALEDRKVELEINNNAGDYKLRGYEIDLDCIFNNLIINSLDSFMRKGASKNRTITITIDDLSDGLHFFYKDTGAGLSKDIKDPNKIFIASFTTKLDKNGKEVGTGMGMWLLKKTLEQYSANVIIKYPSKIFSLEMTFPHLYSNKRIKT